MHISCAKSTSEKVKKKLGYDPDKFEAYDYDINELDADNPERVVRSKDLPFLEIAVEMLQKNGYDVNPNDIKKAAQRQQSGKSQFDLETFAALADYLEAHGVSKEKLAEVEKETCGDKAGIMSMLDEALAMVRKAGFEKGLRRGRDSGHKIGLGEGRIVGILDERREIALRLIEAGLDIDVVAQVAGLSSWGVMELKDNPNFKRKKFPRVHHHMFGVKSSKIGFDRAMETGLIEGIMRGRLEGIEEGREEAWKDTRWEARGETLGRMETGDFTREQICHATNLTPEQIDKLMK